MPGRIPYVVAMLALVCACSTRACWSDHQRVRDVGLVAFEAPYFEDQISEARYMMAQLLRVGRYRGQEMDVDFDSEKHVTYHFQEVTLDLASFDLVLNDSEVIKRLLAPTPELMRFQGARQNAVALGLMAYSIWRRDQVRENATVEELRSCMRMRLGPPLKCRLGARARYLHRSMLMAEYADGKLFARLKSEMPPLRRRIPRLPINIHVPSSRKVPSSEKNVPSSGNVPSSDARTQ